jgi:uncharacterized membrane protein YGL010W
MSYLRSAIAFLQDYGSRHSHPFNALLHLLGVPMVFYGLYKMFVGFPVPGMILFVFGYFLQYLGHRAQGNEVGEVTLIKLMCARLKDARN